MYVYLRLDHELKLYKVNAILFEIRGSEIDGNFHVKSSSKIGETNEVETSFKNKTNGIFQPTVFRYK